MIDHKKYDSAKFALKHARTALKRYEKDNKDPIIRAKSVHEIKGLKQDVMSWLQPAAGKTSAPKTN